MLRCPPNSRAAKPRERTSRLFARVTILTLDWHQWSEVVNREPFVDVPKFTLIWRNSHWLTNTKKSVLWLVRNVASLIPLANSMNCFAGRTSFTFRSNHASCITVLFKLHEIDRRLQSNSWSRLCLWKLQQKVSVQLVLYTLLFPLNVRESKPIPAPLFWLPFLVAADWAVEPLPLLLASGFLYLYKITKKKTKLTNNVVFMIVLRSFLFMRTPFFRSRLNILIFLPILGWKVSCFCIILKLL